MSAFTYMLRCSDGSLYVGSTRDLELRVHQHQIGEGAAYTRRRRPIELVWHEEHENVGAAFDREKQIQNWSRAKRLGPHTAGLCRPAGAGEEEVLTDDLDTPTESSSLVE